MRATKGSTSTAAGWSTSRSKTMASACIVATRPPTCYAHRKRSPDWAARGASACGITTVFVTRSPVSCRPSTSPIRNNRRCSAKYRPVESARGLAVNGQMAYVAAGSAGSGRRGRLRAHKTRVVGQGRDARHGDSRRLLEGRAFVAAWNDARVYDVTNPAAPRFIGAVRLTTDVAYPDDGRAPVTARTLGIAANGNDVFIGNWLVQYAYRLYPERLLPVSCCPRMSISPTSARCLLAPRSTIPIEVQNQGTAPLTLLSSWTSGGDGERPSAFD